MDIMLSVDAFNKYLNCRSKFPKDTLEQSILSLFENQKNRFVISKALIDKIEDSIKGNPTAEAFFQTYLPHITQNQSLNIPASKDSKEIIEIISSMNENYKNSLKEKRDLFLEVSLKEEQSLKNKNSIIIEKAKKPNYHWIFFNLASQNPLPLTLRYSDFNTNEEVQQIFNKLLSKVQNLTFVDIYDRQVNLNHKLFDAIKGKVMVHYYTSYERRKVDDIDKTDDLKRVIKKVKVFKAPTQFIHERRIVLNSLMIETDDDFWNLTVDQPNWKVDLTYSSEESTKVSEKKKHFKMCKYMYTK